ncbi:MAG TPA: GWxTD domain-containing protein [Thermoanaerobaculia bacterium]|nr:GWxTD domain-containing protein [Thermoanaerobaculia bacterium]
MHRKLALIASLFLAVAAMGADDILKWNKTPEAYYMTAAEKAEWKTVASPADAQKFVDQYRSKRGEQFLKDVRTRIDIADKNFKLDKTPGSLTQKGRVFMLLGKPTTARTNRDVDEQRGQTPVPGMSGEGISQSNRLENQAIIGTEWVYEKAQLPPELGLSQLKVKFVYDSRRGFESIDNIGNVEPQLQKAAELISNAYMADTVKMTAARSQSPGAMPSTPLASAPDPLWSATPALNGAMFTGDAFLSPTEETFYAYNFYVPKSAAATFNGNSGLLVTLVRNSAGQQVVADRKQVTLTDYDGARYVDQAVALPPGKYEGLFAFYSPDGTTLLSSQRATFEVPAKETPRASALFLTSKIDTLEKQEPLDPFTFVATRYAVRADRQFRATDKLAFFTIVANPTGSPNPNIMQKMTFRKDGKEFAKTPLEQAQLTQTGPNTFLVGNAFDPETFPAGHYTLELQVRDMNAPDDSPLKKQGWVLTSEFDVLK